MKETTTNTTVEETVNEAKPYTFRKLASDDIFLMLRIFGKIGVRELKGCFNADSIDELVSSFKNLDNEQLLTSIGISVGFDAVDILLNNLPKCENEICQLLTQVSVGVTEAEIRADAILFMEMLVDFVKKEEFPAFIKVVSKLFK